MCNQETTYCQIKMKATSQLLVSEKRLPKRYTWLIMAAPNVLDGVSLKDEMGRYYAQQG